MRIVLDTDPGIDDALAFLYLAAHPEAELVAVGSVHGNTTAPQTAANALRLLDKLGLHHVPVAVGAHRPLAQPLETAEFVHGHDGLGGHAGPASKREPLDISAAEQLVRVARAHPGEITVLALGPLTNIAIALGIEPELPTLLKSVFVLGGGLGVPGNITAEADANFYHDPEAADQVLAAGFDLTLIGLNVTERARADEKWLQAVASLDTPRSRYASAVLAHYAKFYTEMFGEPQVTLHDPLAAAVMLDPALAPAWRDLACEVELNGTHTRGKLVADLRPIADDKFIQSPIGAGRRKARVLTEVNAKDFLERMFAVLQDPSPLHD
ncbi:nucleoside hydrolase [Allokutzneria multivorans]|uniref:Nucleoside hydrolase n=1 Tax=Allokutzneria multivorans TaxID=1142134 RepID=A0ABP7QQL8_9PSEU